MKARWREGGLCVGSGSNRNLEWAYPQSGNRRVPETKAYSNDNDLQARIVYRAECSLSHYPWLLASGFYNLFRYSVASHRYLYGPM